MALVVRVEVVADGFPCCRLEVRVDRRHDRVAAEHRAILLAIAQRSLGDLDDLGRELLVRLDLGGDVHDLLLRRRVLGVVEEVLRAHLSEHERSPRERLRQILARRERFGPGDEPCEQRCLRDRHVLRRLREVVARGLLDAVPPVTEVDVIEVELEDVVFLQLLLEAPREERLADLPPVSALGVEEEVLHHLLRDGRPSLTRATRAEVDEQGSQDPVIIEPLVLVEAGVLRGEDRELHVGRERRDRHHGTPLGEDLRKHGAVARQDACHLRGVVVAAEVGDAREPLLEVADDEGRRDYEKRAEDSERDREAEKPATKAAGSRFARARRGRRRRGHGRTNAGRARIRPGLFAGALGHPATVQ